MNIKMKVLIITYYWPPAGGPGVQRWLKFVKYLPDFGIEPIVYIPENPSYPIVDASMLNEVPKGVTILRKKIIEPYALADFFSKNKSKKISAGLIPKSNKQSWTEKLMLWIRGNLFIPDARVLWVNPSVSYLKKYIQENEIETVITTGPPHSLHLIGLALKKNLKIQWIADFRDPWTTIGYQKALNLSSYAQLRHAYLEKKILKKASKIIVTSPTTEKEFLLKTNKSIKVITNGYDVVQVEKKPLDAKFTLVHTGSFLSDRNPFILWKSLKELCDENAQFKASLEIKLVGKVSDEIVKTIESFGLQSNLNLVGYVSHDEVLVIQKSAQVLLLVEIDAPETRCIIPGKIFEYMVSERPIIAIGPQDSDMQPLIVKTNTGKYFEYDFKDELKACLMEYFDAYLQNNLKVYPVGLQKYSRKNLTSQLASYLKNNS
jgi:hypothetical protein